MKKIKCESINKKINSDAGKYIEQCELHYETQIETVANSIAELKGSKPVILLSGPSGSGKTTTALRIEKYLDMCGIETHTISMDNYFLTLDKQTVQCDENGKIDYESPSRLNIEMINEHLLKISRGEEIEIPQFDFANQVSRLGKKLKVNFGDIVIFEGIHALNPLITGENNDIANGIYVSVRTRAVTSSGKIMHPSYVRLMRRLIRDKLYRGRELSETLDLFSSVEQGENKYIMPYKNRSHFSVDTFIPYEISAYKKYIFEDLKKIYENTDKYKDIGLMLDVLEEIDDVKTDIIPKYSLVREFIGGSELSY